MIATHTYCPQPADTTLGPLCFYYCSNSIIYQSIKVRGSPPLDTIESRGSFRPQVLWIESQVWPPGCFFRVNKTFSFFLDTFQQTHYKPSIFNDKHSDLAVLFHNLLVKYANIQGIHLQEAIIKHLMKLSKTVWTPVGPSHRATHTREGRSSVL